MEAGEIRERFLSFFEARGHKRMPSASLVPPTYDPSVLLTTAGMQPFKPYFRGEEEPPSRRLTSCQKCFRTTDIEDVGFEPERVWISVFGGDEELKLGPDEEAIECWRSVGVPDERIVRLGREDNFWQSGPGGPCGPCSELYYD